jgi:transcriptional regulator GlxA family with amidase domain
MKKVLHILGFVLLCQCLLLTVSNAQDSAKAARQETKDKIRIVSINSAAPIQDGVENEFTIEVEYTLESADAATLMIGFNSEKQNVYRMTTSKRVKKGTRVITLKTRVVPKDWKEYGDFVVSVNLSPAEMRGRWTPYVAAQQAIEFAN